MPRKKRVPKNQGKYEGAAYDDRLVFKPRTGPPQVGYTGEELARRTKRTGDIIKGSALALAAPEAATGRVIKGVGSLASRLGKYGVKIAKGTKASRATKALKGRQAARRAATAKSKASETSKAVKEGAKSDKRRMDKAAARISKTVEAEGNRAAIRSGRTGNVAKAQSRAKSKSAMESSGRKQPGDRTFGSERFKESPKSYAAKMKKAGKEKGVRRRSIEDIDLTPSKSYPKSKAPSKARAARLKELRESSSVAESKRHLDKMVKTGERTRGQKGMSKKAMREIGHPVKKKK